jgi:hypothetical protein
VSGAENKEKLRTRGFRVRRWQFSTRSVRRISRACPVLSLAGPRKRRETMPLNTEVKEGSR